MKYLWTLLLILLVACTSVKADPTPTVTRPPEEWAIVWQADKSLEPVAAKDTYKRLSWFLLQRVSASASPRLNRAKVQSYMLEHLRRLYAPYNISFVIPDPKKRKKYARICWVQDFTKMKTPFGLLFGMADGIDTGNKIHKHSIYAYAGAVMQHLREEREYIDERVLGTDLGTLIAHEIGHTLGLRHKRIEMESDLVLVMTQGAAKYQARYRRYVRWSYNTHIVLYKLLGKKKPRPLRPKPKRAG
jgi:hypothetical protein